MLKYVFPGYDWQWMEAYLHENYSPTGESEQEKTVYSQINEGLESCIKLWISVGWSGSDSSEEAESCQFEAGHFWTGRPRDVLFGCSAQERNRVQK